MEPFLDRFYDEVDYNLADPASQKRLPKSTRYRDLFSVQQRIFERMMSATGQESLLRRSQADITFVVNQEYYQLPPGFRQFISLEKRLSENPRTIAAVLGTVPVYSNERGIEIIGAEQGFRVQPIPQTSTEAGTWIMTYLRGPVKLHYATGTEAHNAYQSQTIDTGAGWSVSTTTLGYTDGFTAGLNGYTVYGYDAAGTLLGSGTITAADEDEITFGAITGLANGCSFTIDADLGWIRAGSPGTDAGELVPIADYYNGVMLQVYSAAAQGYPQQRQVLDFYYEDSCWVFVLRHRWSVVPSGTVLYEILPELMEGYDSLYAMDVAIVNSGRRGQFRRRAGLLQERHDLWQACRNYAHSNTMDRAPQRIIVPRADDIDPYDQSGFL